MRIHHLSVANYKSFMDPAGMAFGPGFNVIVGKNNSGKTALLECLAFSTSENIPHRSRNRASVSTIDPYTKISIQFSVTGREYREIFGIGNRWLNMPAETDGGSYFSNLFSSEELLLEGFYTQGRFTLTSNGPLGHFPSGARTRLINFLPDNAWQVSDHWDGNEDISQLFADYITNRIFRFQSERFSVGASAFSDADYLTNNASNLPVYLNKLQGSIPMKFRKIVSHLKEIIDGVETLSVAAENGQLVIKVWTLPDDVMNQYPVSLNHSGTGVSQVLAILAAASMHDNACICVDEINTFLHPLATKRLLSILRAEYGSNQYVISTHTADIISWSMPSSVSLVLKNGEQSEVKSLSPGDINSVKFVASELGIAMSDVFGSDQIIWVEGPTEEIVFPTVARHLRTPFDKGTSVVAVVSTGDFSLDRKSWEQTYRLYQKVSAISSPLVGRVCFCLDREDMTDEDLEKLVEKIGEDLNILPRRCIENYFINSGALSHLIASVMSVETDFDDVSSVMVSTEIERLAGEVRFKGANSWKGDTSDPEWLRNVDGAKLIGEAISNLTASRMIYRKVEYCELVTLWMVENCPEELEELADYIESVRARAEA